MRLADVAAATELGTRLGKLLKPGDVVTLTGPLGAGKTTIARAMLAALGLAGEAPSPTFAIVQPYGPPEVRLPVLHVDLYRIEDADDVIELGLEDVLGDGALLVEWPERVGQDYWRGALSLTLAIEPDGARSLTADVPAAWERRWPPQ